MVGSSGEPLTYAEALRRPDAEQWRQAALEELAAHKSNGSLPEVYTSIQTNRSQEKTLQGTQQNFIFNGKLTFGEAHFFFEAEVDPSKGLEALAVRYSAPDRILPATNSVYAAQDISADDPEAMDDPDDAANDPVPAPAPLEAPVQPAVDPAPAELMVHPPSPVGIGAERASLPETSIQVKRIIQMLFRDLWLKLLALHIGVNWPHTLERAVLGKGGVGSIWECCIDLSRYLWKWIPGEENLNIPDCQMLQEGMGLNGCQGPWGRGSMVYDLRFGDACGGYWWFSYLIFCSTAKKCIPSWIDDNYN
ncbi:hypothetical protein BJ138DRAFT_1106914 [Hygrophoropsis aurantiaca]|uniref:Uncharacterized protein n=1 Tax=Hygrophoropsis aurantiaca TaxID=72124 RepID=A0ACB7ZUG6_9AGAM|nr:hypothetical protein BJ138DRAFT_1106914 [Hygrophoropsis aurantiaca]